MTKDSKDAHISDSASGGKGESMATESREPRIYRKDWWCLFYPCKQGWHDECKCAVTYSGTNNGLPVIVTQRCTCDCHPKEVRRG